MNGPVLEVTFRSYGKSRREWSATFCCGSNEANALAALEVAWRHNAAVVSTQRASR